MPHGWTQEQDGTWERSNARRDTRTWLIAAVAGAVLGLLAVTACRITFFEKHNHYAAREMNPPAASQPSTHP